MRTDANFTTGPAGAAHPARIRSRGKGHSRRSYAGRHRPLVSSCSPEGARITTGEIGHFNKGAFHLATSLRAPIVPLYLEIPRDRSGARLRRPAGHRACPRQEADRYDELATRRPRRQTPARSAASSFAATGNAGKRIVHGRFLAGRSSPPPRRKEGSMRGTAFAGASLVEMLRFRAGVQPDERAFVFLRDASTRAKP